MDLNRQEKKRMEADWVFGRYVRNGLFLLSALTVGTVIWKATGWGADIFQKWFDENQAEEPAVDPNWNVKTVPVEEPAPVDTNKPRVR